MKVNGFTLKRALRVQGRSKENFPKSKTFSQVVFATEHTSAVQSVLDYRDAFSAELSAHMDLGVQLAQLQAMQAVYNAVISVPFRGRTVSLAYLIRYQGVVSEYIGKLKSLREGYESLCTAPAHAVVSNFLNFRGDVDRLHMRPHATELVVSDEDVKNMLKDANKLLVDIENALAEGNTKMVDYNRLRTEMSEEVFNQILAAD